MSLLKSIFPQVLFREKSPIYGTVEVVQAGSERQLLVNGVRQSVDKNASNIGQRYWSRVVDIAYEYQGKRLEKFLILGLGGGTVAHFICKKFPNSRIDGVELDPVVLEVGERFFGLAEVPGLHIVQGDAFDVVDNPDRYELSFSSYDLIFVDVFQGGNFPDKFKKIEFFEKTKKLLSSGGLVVYNQTTRSSVDKSLKSFEKGVSKVFVPIKKQEVGASLGFSNFLFFCTHFSRGSSCG
ncbi:MAG: hypothetical protein U9M98_02455 [Patescibacteria group bacterium]|nr:hypothetical protein [Patescibacteria group bacterium]